MELEGASRQGTVLSKLLFYLDHLKHIANYGTVAERIELYLSLVSVQRQSGRLFSFTLSIGVASYDCRQSETKADRLFISAEQARYRAKAIGCNQVA